MFLLESQALMHKRRGRVAVSTDVSYLSVIGKQKEMSMSFKAG